jgi:hypothetical protein
MKKDEVDHSPKCMGVVYFSTTIYSLELKSSNRARTFIILDQPQEISNPKLVINWRTNVTRLYNLCLCINLHLHITMNY